MLYTEKNPRRMWAGQVARMAEMILTKFQSEIPKVRDRTPIRRQPDNIQKCS